jgi:hypothetical protein
VSPFLEPNQPIRFWQNPAKQNPEQHCASVVQLVFRALHPVGGWQVPAQLPLQQLAPVEHVPPFAVQGSTQT